MTRLAVAVFLCWLAGAAAGFGVGGRGLQRWTSARALSSRGGTSRLHCAAATAAGGGEGGGLKARLSTDMKEAMKAKDKAKLAAVRAIQTAIKQKEVDERVEVDDAGCLAIMAKLVKQRQESVASYRAAGRTELVEAEEQELASIQAYMPAQLTAEEIESAIKAAILKVDATTIKDMNKVMAELRGPLQGRADMSVVGPAIKKLLS